MWPMRLIENQLHRHTGIGTGKYPRERFLFFNCVLLQDGEILLVRSHASAGETLVARHQFLQGGVWGEYTLRHRTLRRHEIYSCLCQHCGYCSCKGGAKETPPGRCLRERDERGERRILVALLKFFRFNCTWWVHVLVSPISVPGDATAGATKKQIKCARLPLYHNMHKQKEFSGGSQPSGTALFGLTSQPSK